MKKIIILFVIFISSINYGQIVFSHRGGASLAPENTLLAFQTSIDLGVEYYELDLRVSSDDSLVIMHDASVDRTTDGTGSVSGMTYDELHALDAGSWFDPNILYETVPRLEEALALTAPSNTGIIIEIKATSPTSIQKIIDQVYEYNMQSRVIIAGFSFGNISAVKIMDPSLAVMQFGNYSEDAIDNINGIGGEWYGTSSGLTQTELDYAHSKNVLLNKWTVNSAEQMIELMDLGVDAITTDYPQLLIALSDSTNPTDVVLNQPVVVDTKVQLSWSEATDEESGISHYEIYRSSSAGATELLIKVTGETSYIDETLQEEETFYYRVKAANIAGLLSSNYSNEFSVTTDKDLKPPKIKKVSAYGAANKIIIEFNERLDISSVEDLTNYGVSNGITVEQAAMSLDSTSVILVTSDLVSESEYVLSVINIKDLADSQNLIADSLFFDFTYNSYLTDIAGAWDLDLGAGETLLDYTGNDNTGTTFGGLGWGSGYIGNAIELDGFDDYAEINASSSLDITGEAVSISLWTKLGFLPADMPGRYGPIYDSDTDNYVLYEDRGNNELRFKVSTSGGAERPGIPGEQLSVDKWIHVVGVYDGTNAKVYLDGVLMDSHPLTGNVKSGQNIIIGKSAGSFFQGSIDNIQVFAKALSDEEIAFLHTDFYQSFIDVVPPRVVDVSSYGADNIIFINFSEELSEFSSENISNYIIDNEITINSAQLSVDKKTVILTTDPLLENIIYKIIFNDIKDLADIPNSIVENTELSFTHKSFPEGLISYWSFDEGTDTLAQDINNINNGYVRNGTKWTTGQTGNSLRFDAVDDYVEIPNSPSLDIDKDAVTLSIWVLLDYLPADMPFNIGPLYDSRTDNYVMYLDKARNELRFKVSTSDKAERPGIPADTLTTGEWYNVTGVYNGTEAKIFLNGELMDVHNLTGTVKPGQVAHIGQDGDWLFSGQIDNIQLYDRGLTDQEVSFLYSGIKTSTLNVENVDETIVNLKWNDVHDPLLGLTGYKIYRDTTSSPNKLIAFVKDTTGYTDQTRQELTTFYYRVKAVDASGNESPFFSNDVMATTEADLTAPKILSVRTTGEADKIYVNFDETLDVATASEKANYSISGLTISAVEMSVEHKNVILTVSGLTPDNNYTLSVSNIKDVATAGNTIGANTQSNFIFSAYLEDLISYWKLDNVDDTTAVDLVGPNNGSIANSPMIVDGRLGNALFFDGTDDYVEIPNSPSLDLGTEGVSLLAWVKLSYLPTEMPTSIGPIYDAPQDRYVFYEDKRNKELRFKVSTANGAERPGIPEADLTTGEWIHIAGVYDGTQAMIYLNGVQKDLHTGVGGLVKTGQVARIGQDGSHYFNGAIDNVQIYDRGLTPEEVKAHYTGDLVTDVEETETVPVQYNLEQNYPNPFNPSTSIKYSIPEAGLVTLKIYNILGQEVITLINKIQSVGNYNVSFDASQLSTGVYIYRIKAGDFSATKKMMLMK